MQTPLSSLFRKRQKFTLKSDAFLGHKKPLHAHAICTVFALSAEIEHLKVQIAVRLLDGERRTSLQMLRKLKSNRDVAIGAILETKLPTDVMKLYHRLVALAERFDKHRNRFAHWVWADCAELPDRVCFIDPWVPIENWVGFYENLLVDVLQAHNDARKSVNSSQRLRENETVRANTVTYDQSQLMEICQLGTDVWSIFMDFSSLGLKSQEDKRAETIAHIEQRLLNLEAQMATAAPSKPPKVARPRRSSRA